MNLISSSVGTILGEVAFEIEQKQTCTYNLILEFQTKFFFFLFLLNIYVEYISYMFIIYQLLCLEDALIKIYANINVL